jgi:hypothetical protein
LHDSLQSVVFYHMEKLFPLLTDVIY